MDISKINPHIRVAMHSVLSANVQIGPRIIFDYELIYIEYGTFTFNYCGTNYYCKPGDFILIRPDIQHSFYGIQHDLSQPHIHFDITTLKDSSTVPVCFKDKSDLNQDEVQLIREDIFKNYPKNPFVVFTDKEYVLKLFYEIIDTPLGFDLSAKAKLILIIEQLINDNFKNCFNDSSTHYPIEKSVKDYLDAGQGDICNLDVISKHFNYSKYYLDRKFQNAYGISIMAYRNKKRMLLAKEMLNTLSVTEVCEKLGFSSIYVFSRAFKNYFGISPSKAKQQG